MPTIEMIPAISFLYNILKRHIGQGNDVLLQRKDLAKELMDNCVAWTTALLDTFERIMKKWENEGREAAMKEIEAQINDFMKLDYHSLENHSPILLFLREDERFVAFAHSCSCFYESALGVKRLVWGDIKKEPGIYVSSSDVGVDGMVKLWRNEVERMLEAVRKEFNTIRTLPPQ